MTLRSITSQNNCSLRRYGFFGNMPTVARTYKTFSERNGLSEKSKKKFSVCDVDILVENEFKLCFEI